MGVRCVDMGVCGCGCEGVWVEGVWVWVGCEGVWMDVGCVCGCEGVCVDRRIHRCVEEGEGWVLRWKCNATVTVQQFQGEISFSIFCRKGCF